MLNAIVGSLVEAWDEIKVQKARVIMSLIAVVVAVAAMTTVIAMGELIVQAQKEQMEAWSGRSVTITFDVYEKSSDDDAGAYDPYMYDPYFIGMYGMEMDGEVAERDRWQDEAIPDPVGEKLAEAMERFEVPYWARHVQMMDIQIAEVSEISMYGTFQGIPIQQSGYEFYPSPTFRAVDSSHALIFRLRTLQGRWLADSDADHMVVPIVLNEDFWKFIGSPDIEASDPIIMHSKGDSPTMFRVIGVVKQVDPWEGMVAYMPYGAWPWVVASDNAGVNPQLRVWVGEDGYMEQRQALEGALKATFGPDYDVMSMGGEDFGTFEDTQTQLRTGVMSVGALVIALGALGLLNVAIVTVKQRIREIGIRRAVGASAKRVFFAVFMESVVATFVAGVIGVMVAVLIIRFAPLSKMGLFLQDSPAFPMSAALAGLAVSTVVGALAGIIPAIMAVRVKPIDAIRF